jgi:hypothetical protein
MLIAWQTVNAIHGRRNYSDAFLVVCPGITIRDRLRVLLPSDPENYYESRGLVPDDMIGAIRAARVVITNYHGFKLRETLGLPKFARAVLQGRGTEPQTKETEGQMLARVCPELLARKNVVVLNDEAHHCYQQKPGDPDGGADRGGRPRGGEKEHRGCPVVDQRDQGTRQKGQSPRRLRRFRDAVLPARLGPPRGSSLPLGRLGFCADRRDRVRHRQGPAGSGFR